MPTIRHARSLIASAILALALAPQTARAQDVVVFAAASLQTALDAISQDWAAESGETAVVSYGSSSTIASQIEEGAPADIFFSADLAWMDDLEGKALIDPATRVNLLGNRIVLIATGPDAEPVAIEPGFDLAGLLGEDRLATAEVEAVPAGRYGKATLESLDVWESVAGKLAEAENVRAALRLVTLGEAPLGIVYATDAVADTSVSVVGTFPEDSHPPIVYPVALTAASTNPAARDLLAYLESDAARARFEAQGFTVLD